MVSSPSEKFMKKLLPKSFVYFKPKDIVSGDFLLDGRKRMAKFFVAVVDCTGPWCTRCIYEYNWRKFYWSKPLMSPILQETNQILDFIQEGTSKNYFEQEFF